MDIQNVLKVLIEFSNQPLPCNVKLVVDKLIAKWTISATKEHPMDRMSDMRCDGLDFLGEIICLIVQSYAPFLKLSDSCCATVRAAIEMAKYDVHRLAEEVIRRQLESQ